MNIDPYKDANGLVERMKAGTPDIKKKFIKEKNPKDKKKQPAPPAPAPAPEQEYQDDDNGAEYQDFNEYEDEGSDPSLAPLSSLIQEQPRNKPQGQQRRAAPVVQPPPPVEPDEQQDEQLYDITQQIEDLGLEINQMKSYLGTFRNYLMYMRDLLANPPQQMQQQPGYQQQQQFVQQPPYQQQQQMPVEQTPPVRTHALGTIPMPATGVKPVDDAAVVKAKKWNAIIRIAGGLTFIGAGYYMLQQLQMPPMAIVGIIVIALGGGLFSGILVR